MLLFATKGDAEDFGDLTKSVNHDGGAVQIKTRGLFCWRWNTLPSHTDVIDFITIATEGNAQDFGDLTQAARRLSWCMWNIKCNSWCLFAGGSNSNNIKIICN